MLEFGSERVWPGRETGRREGLTLREPALEPTREPTREPMREPCLEVVREEVLKFGEFSIHKFVLTWKMWLQEGI